MLTCMHACMHACTLFFMHAHLHFRTHARSQTRTHARKDARTHVISPSSLPHKKNQKRMNISGFRKNRSNIRKSATFPLMRPIKTKWADHGKTGKVVAMDSLKFNPGRPCRTLLRPAGGPPLKRPYSPQGRWPAAVFYPFEHPTPYAYVNRLSYTERRLRCASKRGEQVSRGSSLT
jgi:hypothetical protein